MTTTEAMKLALEALENAEYGDYDKKELNKAITALREALAEQPAQQEPVAWLITDEKINSLQVDSIQRLIDRARHAHMTDIKLRINGQDEWYQADWLKHLIRATPPQRTWVNATTWRGLTAEERNTICENAGTWREAMKVIEAKLKEKNCG